MGQSLWIADPGACDPDPPFEVYVLSVGRQWITYTRNKGSQVKSGQIDRATMRVRDFYHQVYLSYRDAIEAIRPPALRSEIRLLTSVSLNSLNVSQLEQIVAVFQESSCTCKAKGATNGG